MNEKVNASGAGEKPVSSSWSSPSGLDLNPRPPQTVRISRRTSLALVALVALLLGLFAYGGWKRQQRQVAALTEANFPKRVAPATAAAADIEKNVLSGNVPTTRTQPPGNTNSGQLQAPEDMQGSGKAAPNSAGMMVPPDSYVRQAAPIPPTYVAPVQPIYQPNPEEHRRQLAYESEQRAIAAPTSLREGFSNSNNTAQTATAPDRNDSSSQLASVLQALAPNRSAALASSRPPIGSGSLSLTLHIPGV